MFSPLIKNIFRRVAESTQFYGHITPSLSFPSLRYFCSHYLTSLTPSLASSLTFTPPLPLFTAISFAPSHSLHYLLYAIKVFTVQNFTLPSFYFPSLLPFLLAPKLLSTFFWIHHLPIFLTPLHLFLFYLLTPNTIIMTQGTLEITIALK